MIEFSWVGSPQLRCQGMTVAELRAKLAEFPDDALVLTTWEETAHTVDETCFKLADEPRIQGKMQVLWIEAEYERPATYVGPPHAP